MSWEADRRGANRSDLTQKIGFEEIEPQERGIPFPNVLGDLSDFGKKVKETVERASDTLLITKVRGLRSDLMMIGAKVGDQYELRRELRIRAESETKDSLVQIRLKPRKKRWLRAKARQAGSGASSFLREHLLAGIEKRDRLEEMDQKLQSWIDQIEDLLEGKESAEAGEVALVRKQARETGEKIRSYAKERLFG